MEGPAPLVAVHGPQLGPAQGQVPVRPHPRLVDHDVERAVHRLQVIVLLVDGHRRVHAVLVEAEVPRGLPEAFAPDMGGVEDLVAAVPVPLAPVLLDDGPDPAALGMPEDEAAAEVLGGAEKVELLAEPPVVALLGLLDHGQVFVEVLLGEEGGAVDALELLALLVALPVGPGHGKKLYLPEEAGRRDVGAEAEIREAPLLVNGDLRVALLPDELDLELLAPGLEEADGLFLVQDAAADGHVRFDGCLHLLLDGLEVLGRERALPQEVVVEAVLHRGPDAGLGLRIELEDGVGQEVGGAVAQDLEGFGRSREDEGDLRVGVERDGEVDEPVADPCRDRLPAEVQPGDRRGDRRSLPDAISIVHDRVISSRGAGPSERDDATC